MRISQKEKFVIIGVFRALLPLESKLFLFGSRVDDQLKGGDIDLLVVVSPLYLDEARKLRFQILTEIKSKIGEQKIDLAIFSSDSDDPFFKIAKSGAIELT